MYTYFSKVNLTCFKEQMMHKEISITLTVLIAATLYNIFENSMKSDILLNLKQCRSRPAGF